MQDGISYELMRFRAGDSSETTVWAASAFAGASPARTTQTASGTSAACSERRNDRRPTVGIICRGM